MSQMGLNWRTLRMVKTSLYKYLKRSDTERWKVTENLYQQWQDRTKIIAQWIPENVSVMEFGCGNRVLEQYLPETCTYTPSDIVSRGENTVIIDLNQSSPLQLPKHDFYIFSGVLEYIHNLEQLMKTIAQSCNYVILSYATCCRRDLKTALKRRQEGWMNDYSYEELCEIFSDNGFHLVDYAEWEGQSIFYLRSSY